VNIADVKKELSGDEKVLEKVFKFEKIYKKYKLLIWLVVIGLVVLFVGKSIMQSMHESQLQEANQAFLALKKNENDAKALATLKETNPKLFGLLSLAKASKNKDKKVLETLAKSSNEVIADLSQYTLASIDNKTSDSKLYKEMNILQEAYLALTSGDSKTAKLKLEMIGENSQASRFAIPLQHATLKVK